MEGGRDRRESEKQRERERKKVIGHQEKPHPHI